MCVPLRLRFFLLPLLAVVLLAAEARAAGILVPRDGSSPIEVKSHRVAVVIEDGLARTTLRQTFVNPHRRPLQAIYIFPVPRGASLMDVAMEVNGERLEGLLIERRRARRIYDGIVAQKRDPALVEQIGPGKFRLSVFPVMPKKDTVVELTWVEQIPLTQGRFRYVYPLSLAGSAERTKEDFTFAMTMKSALPLKNVSSPVDDLTIVQKGPGEFVAALKRTKGTLDRDVVVTADVDVPKPTVTVKTFRRLIGDGWFQVVVTPPKATQQVFVPRDVVLVLDGSRSMKGAKLDQAKASALHLIDSVSDSDRVTIVRFGTKPERFAPTPVGATQENRVRMREFVTGMKAGGGSALLDALKLALDVPEEKGRSRMVILLSDGLPSIGDTDTMRIVELARKGGLKGQRIFAFGLGEDVNPILLDGISRAGRGRTQVIRQQDQVKSLLTGFLARTSSPAVANIRLAIANAELHDIHPRRIPDGYVGEQVVITGRYKDGGTFPVTLTASIGGKELKLTEEIEFLDDPGGSPSVMHLYARMKLDSLESRYRLKTGLTDQAYFEALDTGFYSAAESLVDEMIQVSLTHGVQCPYTSFLVLLPEDRRDVDPNDAEAVARAFVRAGQARADAGEDKQGNAPPPEPLPPSGDGKVDSPPPPESHVPTVPPPGPPPSAEDSSSGDGTETGKTPPPDPRPDAGSGEDDGEPPPPPPPGNGGNYRGPAGDVPPGDRSPNDPPPPSEEPAAAGGDAAPPPASQPDWVKPDPGAPPSLGGTTQRPGAGKRTPPKPMTFDHWLFWWGYNKDSVLQRCWEDMDLARIGNVIPEAVPALRSAAGDTRLHTQVRSGALVSLGRAGGPSEGQFIRDLLVKEPRKLGVPASLALGLLGEKDPATRGILLDTASDRDLPTKTRCAALVAVGLVGFDDEATLLRLMALAKMPSASADIPVTALLALGLVGSPEPVPELVQWLADANAGRAKVSDLERSWIVEALGRIGDPRALPVLANCLRKKSSAARRSAVIALGRVLPRCGEKDQAQYADSLMRYLKNEEDLATQNFGVVSLGRIAASPTSSPALRKAIARFLLLRFQDARGDRHPFAAIALGLVAPNAAPEIRERIVLALSGRLAPLKGDRTALGGVAIGIGLAGDDRPDTVAMLTGILRDRGLERKLRAAAATALGLLGAREGADAILETLAEREDRALRVESAAAAALLGDRRATRLLLEEFENRRTSSFALGSAALALGRIGDRTTLPTLIALLEPGKADGKYPDMTRALAAQAIGHVADRSAGGSLSRLSLDINYRSLVPTLSEILSWQ